QCGGTQNGLPSNFEFICIPYLDRDARAAQTALDVPTFISDTLAALNDFGSNAADIPVYTSNATPLALTSMAGTVNQKGIGFSNFWSAQNGHKGPYTPNNPLYNFGGIPTFAGPTLRWGQSNTPFELNVFNAQFPVEFNTLGEIYDTLFRPSPSEPGNI